MFVAGRRPARPVLWSNHFPFGVFCSYEQVGRFWMVFEAVETCLAQTVV